MKKEILLIMLFILLCGCTKCNEYKEKRYTDIDMKCTHQTPVSRIYYSVALKRPMSRIQYICDTWQNEEVERVKHICTDKEKVSAKEYIKWLFNKDGKQRQEK